LIIITIIRTQAAVIANNDSAKL